MKIAFLMRSRWGDRTQFGVVSKTCAKQFFWDPVSAVRDINQFNPDFLFVNKQYDINVIEKLVEKYPMAYFLGDYRYPLPQSIVRLLNYAKIGFFTWKKPDINNTWPKIKLVHQGANPNVYKANPRIEKKYDVIFAGNNWGSGLRMQTVTFLNNNFNFLAIGDGWPKNINSLTRRRAGSVPRYYSQAYITVGIMNRTDFSKNDVTHYTSNRLFNCMAMGIPHIAPRQALVHTLFKKGYQDWATHQELADKINLFLKNKKHAKNVGRLQREEVLNNHTTLHAWLRMEDKIRQCLHSMKS